MEQTVPRLLFDAICMPIKSTQGITIDRQEAEAILENIVAELLPFCGSVENKVTMIAKCIYSDEEVERGLGMEVTV